MGLSKVTARDPASDFGLPRTHTRGDRIALGMFIVGQRSGLAQIAATVLWAGAEAARWGRPPGLTGLGGVGFVVQQRFVGGGLGDTVGTVGRQCGHVVLRRLPSSGVPGVCGEDDERLIVEVVCDAACCADLFAATNSSMKLPQVTGGRSFGARLAPEV